MSTNAIGTGAVILTANADKLASGLDKATKDVDKFARRTAKTAGAMGGKGGARGGGLLGALGLAGAGSAIGAAGSALGGVGIAVGAVAVAVGAAVAAAAVYGAVKAIESLYDGIESRAASVHLGFEDTGKPMAGKKAAEQLSLTFETVLLRAIAAVSPAVERIAPALEVVVTVAGELLGAVVDKATEVVGVIGSWIDSTFDVQSATLSTTKMVFECFRRVATAVAAVWDTIKAGAGVIAYVAGTIVEGFGMVVNVIGDAVKKLDELAQSLPAAIRPDWIAGAANSVKGWGDQIQIASDKMANWGKGAIGAWGQSAVAADKWVDQIEKRFDGRHRGKIGDMTPIKLAGALDSGSAGSYSIVTRNQVANSGMNPNSPERITQELQRQTRDAMLKLAEAFRGAQVVKVAG